MDILKIENITKIYDEKKVLDNISFSVNQGEILSIVGESGSGKTTLARICNKILKYDSGKIIYKNININNFTRKSEKKFRKEVQFIFQNPMSTLNPSKKMEWIIKEPMRVHGFSEKIIEQRMREYLEIFGLDDSILNSYRNSISGGQGQRVLILASVLLNPEILICDEIVSALDLSVQIKILNLLKELQKKNNQTIIFITHDLSVAKYISDSIIVLNNGKLIEKGSVDDIFDNPKEDYTKKLLAASFL